MSLPADTITPIRYPAALRTTEWRAANNGKLPRALLSTVGAMLLLVVAARAMRAMVAAAALDGVVLRCLGGGDSYRTLVQQEALFRARYATTPWVGWKQRSWWRGQWWYRRAGVATAAVPGTSNHGLGLAVDFDLTAPGDQVAWLIAHAHQFGYSGELVDEEWHWRYVAGDAVPAAVTAWENGQNDVNLNDPIELPALPGVKYAGKKEGEASTSDVKHVMASTLGYVLQTRELVRGDLARLKVELLAAIAADGDPAGVDPGQFADAIIARLGTTFADALATAVREKIIKD